ncbi:hypothetical protein [Thalassotalea litorea]|nr:hypothetical protein [Thalassotalea litorea]
MPNLMIFFAILMLPAACLLGSSIIASLLERENVESVHESQMRSAKNT